MTYLVMKNGKPVVSSDDETRARVFGEVKANSVGRDREWSNTGKLFVDGRWTGFEVRPVRELEDR